MREIKFRAWSIKGKEMHYFDMYRPNTNSNFIGYWQCTKCKVCCDPIDMSELMQFTGLLDKNNIPIYEGDILGPMPNDHTPEYKGNWTVVYDDGAFFGQAPDGYEETWIPYWKADTEIEVIGNIHEAIKA